MTISSEQIKSLQELIFDEDLDTVNQGLELLQSLIIDPAIVLQVLDITITPVKIEDVFSSRWPKHMFRYLKLWVFAYLVEQNVDWACATRELNLNRDPREKYSTTELYKFLSVHRLPEKISVLTKIEKISMQNNHLKIFPEELSLLGNLRTMDLEDNYIKEIPDWIKDMRQLEELYLVANDIETVPNSLRFLQKLTKLDMHWNPIRKLEDGTRTLILCSEQWAHSSVRNQVCQMSSLVSLTLFCEGFHYFPSDWSNMHSLCELKISVLGAPGEVLWLQSIPNIKKLQFSVYSIGVDEQNIIQKRIQQLLPNCSIIT
jgi:hypothetical protein